MPNNYVSELYNHIIQVENKNEGLKVCVGGGGGAHTYHCPPPPPPRQSKSGGGGNGGISYASDIVIPITKG